MNPRLIYCSISGYGTTGPRRDLPGYDMVIQGESGLMDVTGFPETGPTKVGVAITDCIAALYAVQGILLAHISGRGPGRDSSSTSRSSIRPCPCSACRPASSRPRAEPRSPRQRTSIAGAIRAVSCRRRRGHRRGGQSAPVVPLLPRRALEQLEHDPRFATNSDRLAHRGALNERIGGLFENEGVDALIERMGAAGVPCGRVRTIEEVLRDAQLAARQMLVDIPTARRRSKCRAIPSSCRRCPPARDRRRRSASTRRKSEISQRQSADGLAPDPHPPRHRRDRLPCFSHSVPRHVGPRCAHARPGRRPSPADSRAARYLRDGRNP